MTIRELVGKTTKEYKGMTTTNANEYKMVAASLITELEYPELIGTPKQIKWAMDIREKTLINGLNHLCIKEKVGTYGRKNMTVNAIKAIQIGKEKQIARLEELAQQNNSKWWIDGRDELEACVPVGYTVQTTEYTIKYDLDSIVRHTQKQLDRLEKAIETGETQVIVRDSISGIVFKITPSGEVLKEQI